MPALQDAQVLTNLARAMALNPVPVPTVDLALLFKQPDFKAKLTSALTTAAIDLSQQKDIEKFLADAGAAGMGALEARQLIVALSQNPQARLQQVAQTRNLTAPTLRADVNVIATRFDAVLARHQLKRSKSVDDFLKAAITSRTHAEAINLATQAQNNPTLFFSQEAKRLGIAVPKPDYDWAVIDAALKPQVQAQNVAWTPGIEKLVRTAISEGVPSATLTRAFQLLQTVPLDVALKQAGVYLVGVAIPDVEMDIALINQRVQTALTSYGPIVHTQKLDALLKDLEKAGLAPAQAYNFVAYSYTHGRTQGLAYAPTVPPSAMPNIPVDVDGYAKAIAQRLGAQWTPAHDAFFRQHVEEAMNKTLGVRNLHGQAARNVCALIANAVGQPLPAGL